MKILRKIKINLKSLIDKLKIILKEKIPVFFQSNFEDYFVRKKLASYGIKDLEKYAVKKWHFKYRYYTGNYKGEKVFIKINSRKEWIKHEYEINKYIETESELISNRKAKIYLYGEGKRISFIVEKFINYDNLNNVITNISNIERIIDNFIELLREFQRISLLYIDLREDNIYIDSEYNIYLIDFGFSIISNKENKFLGSKHLENLIYSNINPEYRLDIGYIDDAISIISIIKKIDFEFIKHFPEKYRELNELSAKLVFNYKE